jgi:hypothetical protein
MPSACHGSMLRCTAHERHTHIPLHTHTHARTHHKYKHNHTHTHTYTHIHARTHARADGGARVPTAGATDAVAHLPLGNTMLEPPAPTLRPP